jgi:hypothetical protein
MLLDSSVTEQVYVEDCEVCCNPIEITVEFDKNQLSSFETNNLDQ